MTRPDSREEELLFGPAPEEDAATAPPAEEPTAPGWLRWDIPFVLVMTGLFLFLLTRTALDVWFKNVNVRPGVRFLGVEVGGLAPDELEERLEHVVEATFRDPILLEKDETFHILHYRDDYRLTLEYDSLVDLAQSLDRDQDRWDRALQYLRADFDPFELPWDPQLDREYTRDALTRILGDLDHRRVFAFPLPNGMIRVLETAATDQLEVVLGEIESLVRERPLEPYRRIEVPPVVDQGRESFVLPADFEHGFKELLARNESHFEEPDRPRLQNIARLLQGIHGQIVNPGEELSLSAAAGPFTTEAGYVEGMSTFGSEPTTTVAVGIDQAASTLFQAMVRAGAEVVERHAHEHFWSSLEYTSPGWDVDLLGGGDLVLRNPWNLPLRITGALSPEDVTIEVSSLERPPDQVEIRVGVPERVAYKTELIQDPLLPRGLERVDREGLNGYRIKIFRHRVRADGRQTREQLLEGEPIDYAPRASRIRIGTGDPGRLPRLLESPEAAPSPSPGPDGARPDPSPER